MEIGLTDYIQIVTTSNYNTIANFHTLQITTAHTKPSAFTSHFPVADINNGNSLASALTKSSLHRLLYKSLPSLQLN
jgi:hypothetical protein